METTFKCSICKNTFTKKKSALECEISHMKLNLMVDTRTVFKIFDDFFNCGAQDGGNHRTYLTNRKKSFKEFFVDKVIEAYKNEILTDD